MNKFIIVTGLLLFLCSVYALEERKIPEEPSDEFIESLEVGISKLHYESGLYYTITKEGQILATGGPDAKNNMQIEIDWRKD